MRQLQSFDAGSTFSAKFRNPKVPTLEAALKVWGLGGWEAGVPAARWRHLTGPGSALGGAADADGARAASDGGRQIRAAVV